MKSLILIPSYLWKNTFKKWFENPISPLSKIILTLLLSLLAILVLILFSEAKNQLLAKLKQANSYTIYSTELINAKQTPQLGRASLDEENLWIDTFGDQKITYLRQPLLAVKTNNEEFIPTIVFNRSLPELHELDDQHPIVWLLTTTPHPDQETVELYLNDISIIAKYAPMPAVIKNNIKLNNAVAIPFDMAAPFLTNGFNTHIIASFDSAPEVEEFALATSAYYKAENRITRSFSALEILSNIAQITQLQNLIRLGIVITVSFILSIVLGTIAWLEFRQEAYLLALLRSFGTPRTLLLIHAFLENILLVTIGIYLAIISWKPIYQSVESKILNFDFTPVSAISLPQADIIIVIIAGIVGVFLAIVPIAIGLRKQPGLILQ